MPLAETGCSLARVRFSDPARAGLDPATAVTGYLDRLDRPDADADRIETELVSWLYDHTADHAGRRLDRARTRAVLYSLADAVQFRRRADFLRNAASRLIGADWTSQARDELLDLFSSARPR